MEYYKRLRSRLWQALRDGEEEALVKHQTREKQNEAIRVAASQSWFDLVSCLAQYGDIDLAYRDNSNNNLLHIVFDAIDTSDTTVFKQHQLLPCVQRLLEAGCHSNQRNDDNRTPLDLAAIKGMGEVVLYLIKREDTDIYNVDINGSTLLHSVLLGLSKYYKKITKDQVDQYIEILTLLMQRDLDVNRSDNKGNTPLFYTVDRCFTLYRTLARSSFDLKLYPPLNASFIDLHCTLLHKLMQSGANVNHRNKEGQTPLMFYVKKQAQASLIRILLPYNDIYITDNKGNTVCSYCILYSLSDCLNIFKRFKLSVIKSPKNGVKLFHQVLTCKRLDIVNYYIKNQITVNNFTRDGENMLHLLARVNIAYSLRTFRWLFNGNLNINCSDSRANTPLMVASYLLNSRYIRRLVNHPDIEINGQNQQGHTCLHLCMIGFTVLIDGVRRRNPINDADPSLRQVYSIYRECLQILLDAGISVNTKDTLGRTALMMAAMKNDPVIIKDLLNVGALLDILDNRGRSAIHYLDICNGIYSLACFKILLSHGCPISLDMPCINGDTFIQACLCFPPFLRPRDNIDFVKYLVCKNSPLRTLVSSSYEGSFEQISLDELNTEERREFRELLYLGGALYKEIVQCLNFEDSEGNERKNSKSQSRDKFDKFCGGLSLKCLCRRFFRQTLGLNIADKIQQFDIPETLKPFLLLEDILHPQDFQLESIKDGTDGFLDGLIDHNSYEIDEIKDGDYSHYNYLEYFTLNNPKEIIEEAKKTRRYPNGEEIF